MALIDDVTNQLTTFFSAVQSNVANEVVNKALPLLGKLGELPNGGAAADPFGALKSDLLTAITGKTTAQEIAAAINGLNISGVSAAENNGGVDITFKTEKTFDTGAALIDVGSGIGNFLDLKVDTGASLTAALNATLAIAADGTASLANTGTPELSVNVAADFSILDLNADLGVAKVQFDDADPVKPEFDATFGFDLQLAAGGAITVTPTLTADVGLNLAFETTDVVAGLLPDMTGEFLVQFGVTNGAFDAPTISIDNLLVDFDSYMGILGSTFGDLADIFNSTPFSTVIDIATEPVPVLDDLAKTFGLYGVFDKVGSPFSPKAITIADLAAYANSGLTDQLNTWQLTIDIMDLIRKLDANSGAMIDFGGGSLDGGVLTFEGDPATIITNVKAKLNELGLPTEVTDFFEIELNQGALSAASTGGFTFGLIENPADVLKILLTNEPVDLVKFDVPPLNFDPHFGGFFPVLGPLGFLLEGGVKANLDVDIGYDTYGLSIDKFEFGDGFFVTTKPSASTTDPWANPKALPFLPAASLAVELTGGAGVGFLGSSLTVNANFGFGLFAYFEAASGADADGKFRPVVDGFDCIFDPVGGLATISVNVTLELDFGIFSVKKNIPLAEATLADFDVFTCPPPSVVATSDAPGLATELPDQLRLNVGDPSFADQRKVVDEHDNQAKLVATPDDPTTLGINESLNESYVIALARDQVEEGGLNSQNDTPPVLVPGMLDVFAFGFTQRVQESVNGVPTVIKADFKNGDDMLVIQSDVTVGSEVLGGDGNDTLIGGGGRDIFRGGNHNDVLSGNANNDDLYGEAGDDQLSGGQGADLMDGGENYDTVDYSRANRGTGIGVAVTITTAGESLGFGGEATGDRLIGIEGIIGTDYSDDLRAGFGVKQNLFFEGGLGNDILIGGLGGDLLLGGIGADHLNGDVAFDAVTNAPLYDGTSYIMSWGAVDVDLQRTIQRGGDAQGDRLFNIEAVEGSINSDTLLGNASNNVLFGNSGNDVMEGRGGIDEVNAGTGNDLVYANADGDTLDGGPGIDTLSYERVPGPVFVDLGFGLGANGDVIVMNQPAGASPGRSTFENLIGSASGDLLIGDIGDNLIEGRDGVDQIFGGAGFDILRGGFGADRLSGGAGIDWVYYDDSPTGVFVNLAIGGSGLGSTADGDVFTDVFTPADIENVLGSRSADILFGNSLDNIIDPNISGATATEFVDGAGSFDDDDILRLNYSSVEADIGQGVGGGFDYNRFDDDSFGQGSFTRLTANGAATLDTVNFFNIERLDIVGTRAADEIYGGYSDDRIVTGAGNDIVFAGNGADFVHTGRGDDFVSYNHLFIDALLPVDVFSLHGGRGIDTLSISLEGATENIVLVGQTDATEAGTNLSLANGAGATGFERLKDVDTGAGNDLVMQLGDFDNEFRTGGGEDIILPGLGIDIVNAGDDLTYGREIESAQLPPFGQFGTIVRDGRLFAQNDGDLLILDYSEFTGAGGVVGTVHEIFLNEIHEIVNDGQSTIDSSLYTNDGTYVGANGDPNNPSVEFFNIERLIVTGSQQGDHLEGTDDSYRDLGFTLPGLTPEEAQALFAANLRGDDILNGRAGDDVLIGKSGSDILLGGGGNDILIGSTDNDADAVTFDDGFPFGEGNDDREIDTLTGGEGADTFVLGITVDDEGIARSGYFYGSDGGDSSDLSETLPDTNRAIIMDFNAAEGDKIQLSGNSSYYTTQIITQIVNGTPVVATLIYHSLPPGGSPPQLIAELRGVTDFSLTDDVIYSTPSNPGVGGIGGFPAPAALAAPALMSLSTDELTSQALAAPMALTAALDPFTVTQNGNVAELKGMLDGAGGAVSSTLTLSGSAEAFGTFENDPFGLGKGIILSTGNVEDLPGPNTLESGGSNTTFIPITFVKIGRAGGSDIFRADLSNLGVDIRSFFIADGNTQTGGAGGIASGFDLDAVALSHNRIDSVNLDTNLNDPTVLERLDVFDFSAASLEFKPGTQRPPLGFPNGLTLDGAINVDIVDNSQSTLGLFHFDADVGSLTLGDGGSLGLQLTQPVSTDGPLYLYIGEEGATGETVIGNIQISADTIEPTGDLSTDLGADGPEGDTTGLTYTFTPGAGHTAFSLDVVLFSEELPEFDGVDLTDLYTIKLNGVDIGALSNGAALSIKNLVYGGSGDLIYNPVGTGSLADQIKADAYTRTITITGAVNPGEVNTLTIEVKDGRDAFLDSGLLIKDGSFKTFIRPELTVQGSEDGGPLFIGGDCIMLTVSLPPGSVLTEPVTVIATASPTLDIGNGPGKPMTLTFKPGELTQEICVYAAPGTTPEDWGTITYEVVSNDPAINGQQIAPEIFDLEQPAQLAFDGEPRPTWSHDHNSDIIWQDFAGGRGDPLILMGNGEVAAHPVHFSPWPTGVLPLWKIAGVGDFNGDGDSEIIWQHDSNNLASLWIMDETDVLTVGQFGSGGQLPVGAPPGFPYGPFGFGIKAIGDVNGDGTERCDLATGQRRCRLVADGW
jgi:Ca2+-binding RTX toxin-like protein